MTTTTHPNVTTINTKIPGTDRACSINSNGRSIIITGINGSGKTQLLKKIYNICEQLIGGEESIIYLQSQVNHLQSYLNLNSPFGSNHDSHVAALEHAKERLENLTHSPVLISEKERFAADYKKGMAVLVFFEATRQANFIEASSATSKEKIIQQSSSNSDASSYFENYLVSQITLQAYAESPNIGNDPESAKSIELWFEKLETDFKSLFEDPTLQIRFDSNKQCFFICQDLKKPYRLQNLSSGFSSLLVIYANLIMKVELRNILPSEIYGLVFIDEIDAHLHVSLQRKILSFLMQSFPKIQFIITTHSPFVVSSVSNAVIYDISTLEQTDDLSMYSYESILKGLFDTPPISQIVTDKVERLFDILEDSSPNFDELQEILKIVSAHESELDSESAMHIKRARILLNRSKTGDVDV
ncbi:AAA family ATPase [Pseudomonas shahriarae]|uniref:AAA family ATPase n=1 Tax=Pseudomonas shahriarae TaxID=2745512 RepID=A0A9X4C5L1_9PSED|nr:AAA family ATPase [Pseudomonas shahriarae]MDD1010646.1 AAA family ATPase [Pseudomonas shahriarae]